ncbi:MAG: NUDIX domain-containing protein [Acidobacteria bacterium]|nr:NUDIX domain-containing protein [Acidobacteriota bacterium]
MRHRESAGSLLYRRGLTASVRLEVLLAHPGGPYWADKDAGAWSIPKGGVDRGETALEAAIREFREETGFDSSAPYLALGSVVQRSGKTVHAWGFEGDCDPAAACSNVTSTEWPPRSGRLIEIPEIDRVSFFTIDDARRVINVGQMTLLDRLLEKIGT